MGPGVEDSTNLMLTNEVLAGYITAPLLTMALELVSHVRSSVILSVTEALPFWDREEDLKECLSKLLRGLINVVPKGGVGDTSGKYCIYNLAMDMFSDLLQTRQHTYPKFCWITIRVYVSVTLRNKAHRSCSLAIAWTDVTDSCVAFVTLHNKGRILGIIWDSFKPASQADLRYLLLVADLHERCFLMHDSLPSPAAKNRRKLLDSALWLELQIWVCFKPRLVGGLHYITNFVHNVATDEEDCISACVPTVHHLR
ncbi:LOW QUALITY PROTEIN: hypothetical protein Cgig2_025059 [Carnegiea gigantea]|uniref:Uncharacterized protein n=1 Tax=Carnegiea gigantea TaxID=171969 RepID=A0A9Q1GNV6_9CARY|nr:LOW QUALITY PROTEIN: hypothetical protein Cgig2_025059 [Carnegiea gigantea]